MIEPRLRTSLFRASVYEHRAPTYREYPVEALSGAWYRTVRIRPRALNDAGEEFDEILEASRRR
jgi:hypothetical protein